MTFFVSTFGRALRALGFLVILTGVARAAHVPSRVYTTTDGLAHNIVNRVVADSHGYLWFCTREGLSRFDGSTFVTYGIDHGLVGAEINDLLETRSGHYWIATNRGLMRFDPRGRPSSSAHGPRMFDAVAPSGVTLSLSTTRLLEDRAGDIWVGTLAGLYRIRPSGPARMEAVPLSSATSEILSLVERQPGELWVGTSAGLYLLRHAHVAASFTVRDGLPGNFIRALLADRAGHLWVAADGGLGVLAVDPNGRVTPRRTLRTGRELGAGWVTDLLQSSNGRIWIASGNGLDSVRADASETPGSLAIAPTSIGTQLQSMSLAEDRHQRLWVGSTNGVARLVPEGITIFTAEDGVPAASSLIQTPRGAVAAMTAGVTREGAVWFDGRRFVTVQLPAAAQDVSWGWSQLMLVDREGDWWFGTRSGVVRFRGVADPTQLRRARLIRRYTRADGLAARVVIRLFEDSRGDVWMATVGEGRPHGLSRWDRAADRLHHYGSADGLPDLGGHFVSAFAEHAGDVTIGFSDGGGLARYRGGRFTRYAADDTQAVGTIRHLFVGMDGLLWAATSLGGVLRIEAAASDRPVFSRITMGQGLSSNEIGAIVEDRGGRIFVGTIRGIDKIDPRSLRVSPHAADVLRAGDVYTAVRDRADALWFGYSNGAIRVEPAAADLPTAPPAVVIDSLTVNARSWPISALGQTQVDSFDVPPGRATLQVGYLTPGLGPADRVRYQIKLEGVDPDWSEPTDQRRVSYASVGSGSYRFAVRALTWDGVPSAATAGFEFRVLAPVWQRWWFLSGALGVVVASGYSLYRSRLSRVQQVSAMRARIARDLHDDIGANLTRIAVLSEVARREQGPTAGGDRKLASIATIARESMTAMSDIVWAINPERDRLVDLSSRMREYAEEVFASDGVELTFDVPETLADVRLAIELRRELYLVFKEATNNAARHSGCSRYRVDVRRVGDRLRITLSDNGCGFRETDAHGNGLANMRRRVARLGGRLALVSRPGHGTTIDVDVPLATRAPRSHG